MATRLRVSNSGPLATANDFAFPGTVGQFLRRKAPVVVGHPDDVEWAAAGGGIPVPTISQQVYVSGVFGSDVTGTGSEGAPYATVGHAYGTILDASPTKTYEIIVLPATYTENVALKAFIILNGSDDSQTTGGFLPTRMSGNFTLDPVTFGGAPVGQTAWITNIDIDGLLTLDFAAISATNGAVYITNCNAEGNALITTDAGNDVEFHDCVLFGDLTIVGGFVFLVNTNGINDTATLTVQSSALASGNFRAFGGSWAGAVNADQNGLAGIVNMNSEGFSMSRGVLNVIPFGAISPIVKANFGDLPENCNMGGAGATLTDQMRISHQFPNIAPNPTAIAGTAVTTISLVVPANLIGATDIETMQCSCSPVGANWGTFIGPHAVSVTFTYRNNAGAMTVDVNFHNSGAGFNITDAINLNFSGYLPEVL